MLIHRLDPRRETDNAFDTLAYYIDTTASSAHRRLAHRPA